jgi:hypothetical protein
MKKASRRHRIVGIIGGAVALGLLLMEIGAQALFWAPLIVAEGFALGFAVSWCAAWVWGRVHPSA